MLRNEPLAAGKPSENHRKMVVLWDFHGIYPLVMTVTVCELEHGPWIYGDFPINSMVIFQFAM